MGRARKTEGFSNVNQGYLKKGFLERYMNVQMSIKALHRDGEALLQQTAKSGSAEVSAKTKALEEALKLMLSAKTPVTAPAFPLLDLPPNE